MDPSDDELAAIAQRARARRGREPMAIGAIGASAAMGLETIERGSRVATVECSNCRRLTVRASIEGGVCAGCRDAERARLERIAARLEYVPPVYRPWTLERPPPFLPLEHVRRALEWLDGSKRVLSIAAEAPPGASSTAAGKSTLAACTASTAAERGYSIRWVHAIDLVDKDQSKSRDALETIRSAPFVVLDGCGKEMGHGRNPAFWASYEADSLRQIMFRAFTIIHQARKQRFVLTFDLDNETLWHNAYDASIMRRLRSEEFADVVTLRRNGKLRGTMGGKAE